MKNTTLKCHGTPVENHCSILYKWDPSNRITKKAVDNINHDNIKRAIIQTVINFFSTFSRRSLDHSWPLAFNRTRPRSLRMQQDRFLWPGRVGPDPVKAGGTVDRCPRKRSQRWLLESRMDQTWNMRNAAGISQHRI